MSEAPVALDNITSGSVKNAMKDAGAKSADLWMVPIGDIREAEGFNVRTKNDEYAAHVAEIGKSILANGYWREKALAESKATGKGKVTKATLKPKAPVNRDLLTEGVVWINSQRIDLQTHRKLVGLLAHLTGVEESAIELKFVTGE